MMARAHVLIEGRVQGVFFRSETQYEASRLGVTGWICNLSDDRVEAVFEGEEESVRKLVEFCKRGPPGAKVTNVNITWENFSGKFQDFRIRYG